MKTTYVEIYYPGSLFPETSTKQVPDRSPIELPGGAYAYSFFDREEVQAEGETLTGKEKNRSGMFYTGELFTIKELKERHPEKRVLISNIEGNGYSKAVLTRAGNWQPFAENDTMIKL